MTIAASQEIGQTFDAAANTLAFAGSVAVGDLVVIMDHQDSGSASDFVAGDCTKTAGTATIGTIQLDGTAAIALAGSINLRIGIWSCLVTGAGSLTFTIGGGSVYGVMHLGSYTGNWDASRLEDSAVNESDTDNTDPTTGDMTSAGAALFIAAAGAQSSGDQSFTEDAAWTLIYEEEAGSAHAFGNSCRRIVGTGTTDAGDWVIGNTAGWVAVGAVYKEAAAGNTVSPDKGDLTLTGYAPAISVTGADTTGSKIVIQGKRPRIFAPGIGR